MSTNTHVTTTLIWQSTAITAALDMLLVLLLSRWVSREQFRTLGWRLGIAGGGFFFLVWLSMMLWAWNWFYSYIFPAWGRYGLPPLFGIGYTLVGLGMVWLSLRLKGSPAVSWCMLGGVEGLLSHLYAIYGLGAASKPPIMQGTDPFAALIFAIFEKACYWGLILLVVNGVWRIRRRHIRIG